MVDPFAEDFMLFVATESKDITLIPLKVSMHHKDF